MVEIPSAMMNEESDDNKLIRELFSKKDKDAKTELTFNQIREICKLRHLERKYKAKYIGQFINDFMSLMVSKGRMGRKEFIEALKKERELKEGMDNMDDIFKKIK